MEGFGQLILSVSQLAQNVCSGLAHMHFCVSLIGRAVATEVLHVLKLSVCRASRRELLPATVSLCKAGEHVVQHGGGNTAGTNMAASIITSLKIELPVCGVCVTSLIQVIRSRQH